MSVAVITGSAGLIGSEACRFFAAKGFDVIGIDNDMRRYFFGDSASTLWGRQQLEAELPRYKHLSIDVRDQASISRLFSEYGSDIKIIIHCAAQPSHDWAVREPMTDFTVNANGTLVILEEARRHCGKAVVVFTSTNKVYGDSPNKLPLVELDLRYELSETHPFAEHGIDETMSIDETTHSLFGVSKVAADLMVQEYGRYFGMATACFRGGCLTGPNHSGAQLHGFLAYLMQCAITGTPYTVFGYKGKQVRDNIHSRDLIDMFWHFYQNPRSGEVYNAGGGRFSNCSMLEAIALCEELTGRKLNWSYNKDNRIGDHIWWISDTRKFQSHYPEWACRYGIREILTDIRDGLARRLAAANRC